MPRCKIRYTLKGYVTIYVLFFGILLISMMMIAFKFQLQMKRDVIISIENSLKSEKRLMHKEYLFSLFKKEILRNEICISRENIMNFLSSEDVYLQIFFEDSVLTFDKMRQLMVISYPFDTYYNKMEYFSFTSENGRLFFSIDYSEIKSK
jgi:hypothetical protein